ncbi:TonB-system energizer ExbB [Campylobacterota bacterium]|nr:TonB-system energizer ExbB [Campylobacterota bacterium]
MIDKDLVEIVAFGILAVMGFIALWICVERLLFFRSVRIENYDKKELLEIALTRNLTLIATIASNAPYIGLLGTVFGIMITFADLSQNSGNMDAATLMMGLALALKATAAGLFVAIPSMIAYNLLLRRAETNLAKWEARAS